MNPSFLFETKEKNEGDNNFIVRCLVQGLAGAGKSFCIDCINFFIMILFRNQSRRVSQNVCLIGCPTGVAAFNVGGKTLHSPFGINTQSKTLKCTRPEEKQEIFRETKALIIDEISMCGCSLLGQVYNAANKCFNDGAFSEEFGNLFMVLIIGDHQQLPPITYSW